MGVEIKVKGKDVEEDMDEDDQKNLSELKNTLMAHSSKDGSILGRNSFYSQSKAKDIKS